ncbi:hypothetical protein E1B28_013394 [Marasmius oreades]|uniref:Uncharacterized protein n=1 Tax=Marasmius oreades TaxID=181124 RepID=A0A9P7RQB6_9AGAR|nr:uncharacterized protein E1B28_013394 [Marasmius oreades]KAG7087428.1 hypothetical protein E1B28_013394 [Marasmius oreades]
MSPRPSPCPAPRDAHRGTFLNPRAPYTFLLHGAISTKSQNHQLVAIGHIPHQHPYAGLKIQSWNKTPGAFCFTLQDINHSCQPRTTLKSSATSIPCFRLLKSLLLAMDTGVSDHFLSSLTAEGIRWGYRHRTGRLYVPLALKVSVAPEAVQSCTLGSQLPNQGITLQLWKDKDTVATPAPVELLQEAIVVLIYIWSQD